MTITFAPMKNITDNRTCQKADFWIHACYLLFVVLNGPISPNNSKANEPNLLKWFGTDVLKTPLPHMPPIPTQGQRVMTVDEIERHQ